MYQEGQDYYLLLKNESISPWIFYVYQKEPDIPSKDVFSLAWFASPYKINPGGHIQFNWKIDYEFVWSDSGEVKPGITFEAGGSKDC